MHCFVGKLNFCTTMQRVPDAEEPCAVWDNETCSVFVQIVSTSFAPKRKRENKGVSAITQSTFYLFRWSDIINCAVLCNNNFGIAWSFNTSSAEQNINYTLPTGRPPLLSYSESKGTSALGKVVHLCRGESFLPQKLLKC